MDPAKLDELFARTFDDRRLSRSERRALQAVVEEKAPTVRERLRYLERAFAVAREEVADGRDAELVEWLEAVSKALFTAPRRGRPQVAEALFAPGEDCADRLIDLLDNASSSVDICVFTITHNILTDAILRAHRRGVGVRILTDDDKADDLGSDVFHLAEQGIPVRMDGSPEHMHHKFAVFDRRLLVSGSYNWTRSAALRNRENLAVMDDERLVEPFVEEFERLWEVFGG